MLGSFSHVWLFATLWTVAHQAPLSIGFSRQEYQSGLLCPPPGDSPNPGIKPASFRSPALSGLFFTTCTTWEAHIIYGSVSMLIPDSQFTMPLPQLFHLDPSSFVSLDILHDYSCPLVPAKSLFPTLLTSHCVWLHIWSCKTLQWHHHHCQPCHHQNPPLNVVTRHADLISYGVHKDFLSKCGKKINKDRE